MRIGALTLFRRMRTNECGRSSTITIAALHWKHSLTWSWSLTWHPASPYTRRGFHVIGWRAGRVHAVWNTRRIGDFAFQRQGPMWLAPGRTAY